MIHCCGEGAAVLSDRAEPSQAFTFILRFAARDRKDASVALFDHYLYILECGDGSLYTGYTTNVAARVAAHRAGDGAKYTRSHAPVRLVAQARFYSKERAMSAEARFKQLDRSGKDALLARAAGTPLEEVLREELPGFAEDTAGEFVCRSLAQNVDLAYKSFNAKLLPTVDAETMAGVRTPVLRKIAKELIRREDAGTFLEALPHRLFEENQVHAFAIGLERGYDTALSLYDAFLPYVDNWATCDQMPVKTLATRPDETLTQVERWLASGRSYTIRFAMGVLMRLYLEELFEERLCSMVADTRMSGHENAPATDDDIYYVDMMRAWFFAEALAKQEATALPYLERQGEGALLDEWTRRKAIQKAIESRRISDDMKGYLRTLR